MNYYNENDPAMAVVLRALIADGALPEGFLCPVPLLCRDRRMGPGARPRGLDRGAAHGGRRPRTTPQTVEALILSVLEPSSVWMENTAGYQLNPRFSLWLMGYPGEWERVAACALRCSRAAATLSSRSAPRSSSPRGKKPLPETEGAHDA